MNEKITVRASVVKEVGNLNQEKQINSQLYDSDYQGYSLGFNYKITDNMSIGGEISIDKGYNPFYYNQNSLYRGNSFGTSHYQSFPGNSFYGW
jgi:long-subunit fatty acid transport protein